MNSLTLSITYVGCHSVFIDDFKVYSYYVFTGDLWISNDNIFDNSLRQPWLYFCYRLDASFMNSVTLSILYVRCHSVFIDNLSPIGTLFSLMDQQWHSVFDNSMHQPWLYFCYWFDKSVVNSLTLSIPYGCCHSVFIDDFKFNKDSVFADDLWIISEITFLTIPCVNHDSIISIDLMCQSWIHWRYRLYTSALSQYSLTISSSTGTLFSLTIYGSVVV